MKQKRGRVTTIAIAIDKIAMMVMLKAKEWKVTIIIDDNEEYKRKRDI